MPHTTTYTATGWFAPAVTTFVSFVTGAFLEWLRNRSLSSREREAREATRREQRFEQRTNFQRQTLLDLQESILKLVRATVEMDQQAEIANYTRSEPGKPLYGEDLRNQVHTADIQTIMLAVRVRDEMVRNLVKEVKDASRAAVFYLLASKIQEAAQDMLNMATAFNKLNERIGELLRKLDDDEDCDEKAGEK